MSHVTHDFQAKQIDQGDNYVFKPKEKTGKGGRSSKSTYRIINSIESLSPNEDTKYELVYEDECLLPGCYSWWSPSHEIDHDDKRSIFGNNEYRINLTELLKCYQQAMKGESDALPNIHFRCGGTFRYKKQACKVIIVCPVKSFEPRKAPPFDFGDIGLGNLSQRKIAPMVYYEGKARRNTWFNNKPQIEHTTYAFAFYFPNDSYELKVPKNLISHKTLLHNFCFKKEYDRIKRRIVCPNEIERSDAIKPVDITDEKVKEEIEKATEEIEETQRMAVEETKEDIELVKEAEIAEETKQPTKRKLEDLVDIDEPSSSKRFALDTSTIENEVED